jgi:nucleotide-binding universal stress UspA family protein
VVPEASPEPLEREALLLCYDGSEGSRRAIELAGELFPGRQATVAALWQSWVEHAPKLGGVGPVAGMKVELDEIAEVQSRETAAEGVALATEAGLVAEPLPSRVIGAPIWRGVVDTAEEQGAAAIVMGSRGLTGIGAALGSVSHGVVHHSHLPVLVVPSPA